ncbi:MAG: SPOR domain-containing protein [Pseudomonadota bacterium]
MAEAAERPIYREMKPSGPPTPIAWLMGLTTCVLTAGVIYWGVQLAQRDPASLPVIRAPHGVARLEPAQGNNTDDFAGLAVTELQSASGPSDGEAVEAVALAPAGVNLSAEDVPAMIDTDDAVLQPVRVQIDELDGEAVVVPEQTVAVTETDDTTGETILAPVTAEEVEEALAEALRLASAASGQETAISEEDDVAVADDADAEASTEAEDLSEAELILLAVQTSILEESAETSTERTDAAALEDEEAADIEQAASDEATPDEVASDEATPDEVASDEATPDEVTEKAEEVVIDVSHTSSDAKPMVASTTIEGQVQGKLASEAHGGIEVATAPVGTSMIQLGVFNSRDLALSMWKSLQNSHSDKLSGRSYIVEPVESGGNTLHRLRVLGFETTQDARAMCADLKEKKTACIAVTQRG